MSISLTKVAGRHTIKTGFYINRSIKRESVGVFGTNFGTVNFGNDTANPFDTSFGFANAAIGSFTEFSQANSYTEGTHTFDNREAYVQDNWKATSRLTLDYGVRFVNATPLYDKLMQGGNWLPERWTIANAPALYTFGCANGVYPCTGNNRQAMNPVTGQFLGPNTAVFVGTLVPNSGNPRNALVRGRSGHRQDELHLPEARGRAALRHGLRCDRQAAHGRARRHRHVLRPAPARRRPGARRHHWRVRDGALFAAAEPRAPAG